MDLTGYIFKDSSNAYWKILSQTKSSSHKFYNVVRCSKTGKQFAKHTSFSADYVESLYKQGMLVKCELAPENSFAKTSGKSSGIRKRRIAYLKKTIERLSKELEELSQQ